MPEEQTDELRPMVRTLQIIVAALVAGVCFFGGYVLLGAPPKPAAEGNMLTLVAIAVGAGGLVLAPLVAAVLVRGQVGRIADGTWQPSQRQGPAPTTDAGRLANVYATKTIISGALFEGPCFLALLAYMTERHWAALLVAGLLGAGLLAHLPTYGRVSGWVQDKLQLIEQTRQFRG
jgi:hypothetical protein